MTQSSLVSRRRKHAAVAGKCQTRASSDCANPSRSADLAANWSPDVVNALSAAATRIRPSAAAWRLWQRLSAAERLRLGDDFDAAFGELGGFALKPPVETKSSQINRNHRG